MKSLTKTLAALVLIAGLLLLATSCGGLNEFASSPTGNMARDGGEEVQEAVVHNDADVGVVDDADYFAHRPILADDSDGGHTMGGGNAEQVTMLPAGTLTAGEWRDNRNWDDWVKLFEQNQSRGNSAWQNMINRWQLQPLNRVTVRVTRNGVPVRNEAVTLVRQPAPGSQTEAVLWNARTDHEGLAYLFSDTPITGDDYIKVNSDNLIRVDSEFMEINAAHSSANSPDKTLDLMLVFDTTGSMGDELRYLQAELEDVINTVRRGNANIPTRLSVNFYRDHDDQYVILPHEFTNDIPQAIRILNEQSAAGGGDWPEALDEALIDAVYEKEWQDDSVKIMLLVLDAPAHERQDAIQNLQNAIAGAASNGIRIVPVMASGNGSNYDLDTEFLLRTFAVMTGGTFTFLTDHSGVGNPHAEPTIGAYQVEKLNEMLIRIINEYLS
ncbi:MAG: VWA domain-containing protein [Oscillospiraceae bacterium]|nr:VWA domain-containing protein [Oscillospiraceae bacterium]